MKHRGHEHETVAEARTCEARYTADLGAVAAPLAPATATSGQDRESYTDTQDRESYTVGTVGTVGTQDPPEGVHYYSGVYHKVQVAKNGSGRKYAKLWNDVTHEWEYVGRRGLARLSTETLLTAEQAAQWGHLYSRCVFCGRDLTDERSIAAGYGEICADYHGLPWGAV